MKRQRLTLDDAIYAYRHAPKGYRQNALARLRDVATAELKRTVRERRQGRRAAA